jgi:hypothetical protein
MRTWIHVLVTFYVLASESRYFVGALVVYRERSIGNQYSLCVRAFLLACAVGTKRVGWDLLTKDEEEEDS